MKKCSRATGQKTLFQSWNKQNKANEKKRLFDTWDEPCSSTSGNNTETIVDKHVDNMIVLDNDEDDDSLLAKALEQIDQQDGNLSFSAKDLNDSINNDETIQGFDYSCGNHWIYPINYPVREYQFNIVKNALFKNTLVTLPTGLGKTFIAAVVMYNFYRWFPQGKIIFMAPTKPLVAQQIEACYNIMGIPRNDTAQLTGGMAPQKREHFWVEKRVFFMTPQVFQNDISRGSCHAEDIVCIVIDEAHKALGNHAYCQVIREVLQCNKKFRVLSLSATPGDDLSTVQEILTNLLVSHIELRSEDSADIKPYTHERQVETIVIQLGDELQFFKNKFLRVLSIIINKLFSNQLFWLHDPERASKYALLAARDQFRRKCATGEQPRNKMGVIEGDFAVAISFYHAYELMLQHGLLSFYNFIKGIVDGSKGSSRAKMELSRNPDFVALMEDLKRQIELPSDHCNTIYSTGENRSNINPSFISHPKLTKLKEVVLEHFQSRGENGEHVDNKNGSRVMIFSQYRDSVYEIANMFSVHQPLVRVMRFIGQQSRANNMCKGLTQKEQTEAIRQFRNGDYNTLVATSVGEEGLDIGEVDLIICFDASSSPIRLVQRMGRTGRKRQGKVVILVTEGKEEQTYKKTQRSKNSIQKGILQSAKKLELYLDNPRMVPNGIKPVCQKLFITIDKPETDNKNKNRKQGKNKTKGDIKKLLAKPTTTKEDGLLKTEELSYWNEHFKLPQHEAGLTPSKSRLDSSNEYELSLSEWTAWQTSLQPFSFVNHSQKTRYFTEILEFCDFRRDCGKDDDAYHLEMQSFLNMDDIINTEKNMICDVSTVNTSTTKHHSKYPSERSVKNKAKNDKTEKNGTRNNKHSTESKKKKQNNETIDNYTTVNNRSGVTECGDNNDDGVLKLDENKSRGGAKKGNSSSSSKMNEPRKRFVNIEEDRNDDEAVVDNKTTCIEDPSGNNKASFEAPKSVENNKNKLKKNTKRRRMLSFDIDDDFEEDTSFLRQKSTNEDLGKKCTEQPTADSRKQSNKHKEVIHGPSVINNEGSEDELTKLLDIPCSQRTSEHTTPLPEAPSLDTLFDLCDTDNEDISLAQPQNTPPVIQPGTPTMIHENALEETLGTGPNSESDVKGNNVASEGNYDSTDEELPRCNIESAVDKHIENFSEEIDDEYLQDVLLDDLKTPCLFDEEFETQDSSCKYRRIGRKTSPDSVEKTPRKNLVSSLGEDIESESIGDHEDLDYKEDDADFERTSTNIPGNKETVIEERTIAEMSPSVAKIRSFSFKKPLKEPQLTRSLDPNDFRLSNKATMIEDDLVAPSPQKELLHRSFISGRTSLNVTRGKMIKGTIFKDPVVKNLVPDGRLASEGDLRRTEISTELAGEIVVNKQENSNKKSMKIRQKTRDDSPVFPHLTTPKITDDCSLRENTSYTNICCEQDNDDQNIFIVDDVDDEELLELVASTSQEFGIDTSQSIQKPSLDITKNNTIRTPCTSNGVNQRTPIRNEGRTSDVIRKARRGNPHIASPDLCDPESSVECEDSPIVMKRGRKCMKTLDYDKEQQKKEVENKEKEEKKEQGKKEQKKKEVENKEKEEKKDKKEVEKKEQGKKGTEKRQTEMKDDSPIILRRRLKLTKSNNKLSNSRHNGSDVVFNGEMEKPRCSKYFIDVCGKRRRSTESDEEFEEEIRNHKRKPAGKQLSKNRKRQKQQDNEVNMFLDQEAEVSDDHNQSSDQDIGTSDDYLDDSFIDDRTQLTQRSPLVMKSRLNKKVDMMDIYRGSLMTPHREELKFSTPALHRYKNCYKMVYNKNTSISSRSEYGDDYESDTDDEEEEGMDERNEIIDISTDVNKSDNISPEASQVIMRRDRRKRKVLSESESPEHSPILNRDNSVLDKKDKNNIKDRRNSFNNFKKPFSEIGDRTSVRPVGKVTALCNETSKKNKHREDMDELLAALEQSDDSVFMEIDDFQTSLTTTTTTTSVTRKPSISNKANGISADFNTGVDISTKQSHFDNVQQSRVDTKEQEISSITNTCKQSVRTSLLHGDDDTTTKTGPSSNIHHTLQNKTGAKVSPSSSVSTAPERANNKLTILVSSTEVSNCQITSFLRRNHNVNAVVSKLEGCDYIVSNRMAVERRLVSDVSNASNMSKLLGRIRELCDLYDRPCLIIETDRLKRKETNNNPSCVRSKHFNRVLACLTHVKVLFSNDQENTASILASLAQVEVRKKAHIIYPFPLTKEREQIVKFLSSIPRISYITAVSLSFHNRSLQEITNSSVEELVKRTNNLCPNRASDVINFMKHHFAPDMVKAVNT